MPSPPNEASSSLARGVERGVLVRCSSGQQADQIDATLRSIRRHEPGVAVAVVTEAGIAPPSGIDPAIILQATPGETSSAHITMLMQSPFDKTLCVTAGAVACRGFAGIFDLLDRVDLAVPFKHGGRVLMVPSDGADRSPPASPVAEYLPQVDSTIFAFRRSPDIDLFMERWGELHRHGGVDDDTGFAQSLLENGSVRYLILDPEFALHPDRPSIIDAPVTFLVSDLSEVGAVACGAMLSEDQGGIRALLGMNLVVVRDRLIEIVADLTRVPELPSASTSAAPGDSGSNLNSTQTSDTTDAPAGSVAAKQHPGHDPATGGPVVMVMGMLGTGIPEIAASLTRFDIPILGSTPVARSGTEGSGGSVESDELIRFNEEILARLGGSRFSPPNLEPQWDGAGIPENTVAGAAALFAKLAHGGGPVIWQDPRNCLLLPFWRRLIDRPIAAVVTYRHPSDVAQLLNGSGIHPAISVALWSVYTSSALRAAAGLPLLVVRLEDAVADPGHWFATASGFLQELGVPIPASFPLDQIRSAADARPADSGDTDGWPDRSDSSEGMLPTQAELFRLLEGARGAHFPWVPPELPEPDAWVRGMLNWS